MTTSPVMTVTDELLAELDRGVRVVWRDDDATVIAVDALTAELRRLRAENAELAKDAGRYRAIRHSLSRQQRCSHTEMPCISDPISPFVTYTPEGLDTAIDTAMAAK